MRVPPFSLEAEQACLGACFIDQEAFDKVSEIVAGTDDFYKLAHQVLYGAMIHLSRENHNIDLITVGEYLRQQNKLEEVGGFSFLDQLSGIGSAAHVVEYAHIVADKAIERRLINAGNAIVALGFDAEENVGDKVDKAEEVLFAVSDTKQKNVLLPLEQTLSETFTKLYESYKLGNVTPGLPTGWLELDNLIGGMLPGQLIVIGARPSMGKTAFSLNLALNAARDNETGAVAVFSLEMSRDEIQQRLLCTTARVNNMDLRQGRIQDQDWQRIASAVAWLETVGIYIDDQGGQTVLEIKSKLRRLCKKAPMGLVIIDYLQLMRGSAQFAYGPVNRVQEISEITRQLKGMAKELQVPVVALSQLSRNLEARQDKRPIMADLRESGSIEQDADLIAFLYRDVYYNPASMDRDQVEIIVAKQRNGPVDTVKLKFVQQYGLFASQVEAARWHERTLD